MEEKKELEQTRCKEYQNLNMKKRKVELLKMNFGTKINTLKNKNMKNFWHHIGKNGKKLNYAIATEHVTDEKKQSFEIYKILNDVFYQSEETCKQKTFTRQRHLECSVQFETIIRAK